ncbi:MAG: NAD(P)-dependent oxidoreductase [Nitrososphaeraceae archaeon]
MKIGSIGLGLLGKSISIRLLNCGYKIGVYNRTYSKSKLLERKGAIIYETPEKLANMCDMIILCVTNFEAINDILFHQDGLVNTTNKKLIVSDFSTITPKQGQILYEKLKENRISFLNTPVMGGPTAAIKGHLIAIVSGDTYSFKKIKPILEKLGNPIFYIGDRPGIANAIKLSLNLNIAIIAAALSEGLVLSSRFQLDPNLYLQILNSTYFKTNTSENKGLNMVNDRYPPSFYLKNMRKDLNLVMEAAKDQDILLPVTNTVLQLFDYAQKFGLGNLDYTAIYKLIKKLNHIN